MWNLLWSTLHLLVGMKSRAVCGHPLCKSRIESGHQKTKTTQQFWFLYSFYFTGMKLLEIYCEQIPCQSMVIRDRMLMRHCGFVRCKYTHTSLITGLKALNTSGNCQRPVFKLGVSQHSSKSVTNLDLIGHQTCKMDSIGHQSCKRITRDKTPLLHSFV